MSTATQPKKAPIPALMPLPDTSSPFLWPVAALNYDAEAQALQALHKAACKKSPSAANHTTRIALIGAMGDAEFSATSAFKTSQKEGVLLCAFRGSKALVQALPASLKGGAA